MTEQPPGTRWSGTLAGAELLARLERYYDIAPRATADAREIGPFTLFVAQEGWPYYARPRLGEQVFRPDDVANVLRAQRELGVPRKIEWLHEVTPSLLSAARAAGLAVQECPLLVMEHAVDATRVDGVVATMLEPDDARVASARAAVQAGFGGTDELTPGPVPDWITARLRRGLVRFAGAFEAGDAAVGGGSHSPRDDVSELTGIAVLPRWRRRGVGAALTAVLADDAVTAGATTVFLSAGAPTVARVYERVGFRRVATACIVEPP
jgi:GNAT superfamily N-acetyltransferase